MTEFSRAFWIFQKNTFWISGFLDFWISGFFWISGYISATKRATGDPLVSKRPDFRGLFGFSKKNYGLDFWISGFLDFWISGFFWISGYISATKRATGDPLVSKRPDFRGLF